MVFRPWTALSAILQFAALSHANAATLVEDFSNPYQCDFSATTGLWNSYARQAQAAVFGGNAANTPGAPADPTRTVSFGDGSDGAVNTASGYTFDTTKPGGYQFTSLTISGGTINITGNQPLKIRVLGAVSIAAGIDVSGGAGGTGTATAAAGAGGIPKAGGGFGGAGGTINTAGSPSLDLSSTTDTAGGAPGGPAAAGAPSGNVIFLGDFDAVPGSFAGGGSGGGGGTTTTSGGGGGAGGGYFKISALGPINLTGAISARGGNGGGNNVSAPCSGVGAAGNGGLIWLQSLVSITTTVDPDTDNGTDPTSTCGGGAAPAPAQDGDKRADLPGGVAPPNWLVPNAGFSHDLANTVPGAYVVKSKAYDLRTLNASFTAAPTVTQNLAGGTISIQYEGSKDGTTYTAPTTDILTLSNLNIRYLKITMNITAASGTTPTISKIEIPYTELGVPELEFGLGFGCGSLAWVGGPGGPSGLGRSNQNKASQNAFYEFLVLITLMAVTYRVHRHSIRAEHISARPIP
ncbi:MAG: hypothetical protein JNL01_15020 [Bdellovibrionales bacterium]|nr:hypothetical protein [Bdellovibrionales bacterium]